MPDIQQKVDDSAMDFITGKKSIDSDFDSYIEELEGLHIDEVTEVRQTQYNRYLKALKNS